MTASALIREPSVPAAAPGRGPAGPRGPVPENFFAAMGNFLLTLCRKSSIILIVVPVRQVHIGSSYVMQQYRSGHNGHDWKSCNGQKPFEGSNPSCCAKPGTVGYQRVPGFPCICNGFSRFKYAVI